jgi:AcrR family transcriptional regulator
MKTYYTETKNKLNDALWELLKTNTLENTTIAQICKRARIGRRTFYRHFHTKRNVIEYGFWKKGKEFASRSTNCGTFEETLGEFFCFFKKNKNFVRAIQKNNLRSELYNLVMTGELFDVELEVYMQRAKIPNQLREYVANTIAAMQTSLLITWAERDFAEDWREIVAFEMSLFSEMIGLKVDA